MPNSFFQFKQFNIQQDMCAMKVATDSCLFGAWVSAYLQEYSSLSTGITKLSIVDVGTGTGLLSLMMAQTLPAADIVAVEIDDDAARQAKQNFQTSPWNDRIQILNTDIRKMTDDFEYQVIVSNPPFYENDLRTNTAGKNLSRHNDGLLLKELISWVSLHLTEAGIFFILIPYKRQDEICRMLIAEQLFPSKKIIVRPGINLPFTRVMTAIQKIDTHFSETEMSIKDEDGDYSNMFKSLLRNYYLKL